MLLRIARRHLSLLSGYHMHWLGLCTARRAFWQGLSLSQILIHTTQWLYMCTFTCIHTHAHTVEIGSAFVWCILKGLPHLLPDCGETAQCFQWSQPQGPCRAVWMPRGTATRRDTAGKVCWKPAKLCIQHPALQNITICRPYTIPPVNVQWSCTRFIDNFPNFFFFFSLLPYSYKARIGEKYTAAQKASIDLTQTLHQVAALYSACK